MLNVRTYFHTFIVLVILLSLADLRPAGAAQGRKFALVIGVGKSYLSPAFRTLQFPEQDASHMAARLQKLGFTVVAEAIGEKATKNGIAQAIDDLSKAADSPFDLVFVYYSGHGAIIRGRDRAMPSLVPQDAVPGQKTSFITDTELGTWLNNLATRQVVLIFDSCYSAGIGAAEKRLTDAVQMSTQDIQARLQAVQQAQFAEAFFKPYVIMASSQARETSKETEKGGLFTYFLLQGLGDETTASCPACDEGQNEITMAALLNYASTGVQAQVDQLPQMRGNVSQAEQVALVIPWVKPVPGVHRPRPTPVPATPIPPAEQPVPAVTPPAERPLPTPSPVPSIRTGRLTITTSPSGAKVKLGNKTYITPMTDVPVPPGIYTVTITHTGYETIQEDVEVDEDRAGRYAFHLVPAARPTQVHPSSPTAPSSTGQPPAGSYNAQVEKKKQWLQQQFQQLMQKYQALNQQKMRATSEQERQQIDLQIEQLRQRKMQLEQWKKQLAGY